MNDSPPRVLVTGLNGFTGAHLCSELQRAGYEVHGTVRANESPGPTRHIAELTDFQSLRDVVAKVRPRSVVHLAAVSFVAHQNVEEIYTTNIVGTHNLLRALTSVEACASGLQTVLLASSANIYGNTRADPIVEDQPPHPANDYAVSKVAMEQMAALWEKVLPITIVRPFNYTGVGQAKQFLVPKIVDAFASRAPTLELGNIDVERDYSDVRDVVQCYRYLLEASPRGTFNVCSQQTSSLRELIAILSEATGHAPNIRINPAFVRANEVQKLLGCSQKLKAVAPHWNPRPIRNTLQWMLDAASPVELARLHP